MGRKIRKPKIRTQCEKRYSCSYNNTQRREKNPIKRVAGKVYVERGYNQEGSNI
jgi:hypothetical protein